MDEDEPYTRVVDQTKDGPEGCYETINAALLNIPAHSIIRVHDQVSYDTVQYSYIPGIHVVVNIRISLTEFHLIEYKKLASSNQLSSGRHTTLMRRR